MLNAKCRVTAVAGPAAIALLTAALGCGSRNAYTPAATPAVMFTAQLAEEQPAPGTAAATVGATGQTIHLHGQAELTNADILQTKATEATAAWGVSVELTPQGAAKLAKVSRANQGKLLAIVLNGKIVSAPKMHAPLGSKFIIEGGWSEAEANGIAKGIAGQQ